MEKIFNPVLFSTIKSGITRKQLTNDILAGIVVGIVALPLAIAFAVASGVSPEKGLITAIVAGLIISALGGSRVQIGGPTGAFIVILYSILAEYGLDGLLISTILAGVILIIFGLLRLGSLLKFFPQPLIIGFTSGIAIIIFSTQIKDALGLQIEKMPSAFHEKWITIFSNIDSINFYAVAVTVATILITLFSSKIIKKIPGSFVSIILITLIVNIFKLPVSTIESFFGDIPSKIEFAIPSVELGNLGHYLSPALTIALLGSIESLLSAVVADGMIGSKHRSNTELIAQGVANIVAPFFGGIAATGAIARTATNINNGGRSPIAGISHAITLLLIMLFFGQWAKLIPMSCLAGILIVVAYNMSEWRSFTSILKGSFFDIIVLLCTFFLTVFIDLTVAIQFGIVLSALLFMKRMADISKRDLGKVDKDLMTDYTHLPSEITVYEISGPLFFGSAKQYFETITRIGKNSPIMIIRMRHVPFVDNTGLHNLGDLLKFFNRSNTMVILSGVNNSVLSEIQKSDVSKQISDDRILDSFDAAIAYAKNQLSKQ
ncbi:STAS domain-containing protein [Puteibacter caeruleilacunae]|nr:STAS domain-containing protein [Puteibacter caeruleilacunae]